MKAIELEPHHAIYHCNLSAALLGLRNYVGAAEAAEKAVELDPLYDKAYVRWIQSLVELVQGKEALDVLIRFYEIFKSKGKLTSDLEKIMEQKAFEVKKALIKSHNMIKKYSVLLDGGKPVEYVAGKHLSEYLSNGALFRKLYPHAISRSSIPDPKRILTPEHIIQLTQAFETEKPKIKHFSKAKKILNNLMNERKGGDFRKIVGCVDEKYIKQNHTWFLFAFPVPNFVDATDFAKYKSFRSAAIRPYTIQIYEETADCGTLPLLTNTVSQWSNFKGLPAKHPKFGYALDIVSSLCEIIVTKFDESNGQPFLPDQLVINCTDYMKSVTEAMVNYIILQYLPGFKCVVQVSRHELPFSSIQQAIQMFRTEMSITDLHPFVAQKCMREACEERGEIFTHEFGHSLFEALSDLGELRPWKIFSTDFAIYVTIRHSKYFENTPFNAPNLTNLINKRGVGIEGLDFMDGRKERIICVMGHTDPNSSGFSVLNDLDAFLTFIPKPYVIEQVPSVQYTGKDLISHDDLDDIKAYDWPIYKGDTREFYPMVESVLKNFFLTPKDASKIKRCELRELKWIEAAARGLSAFIRKRCAHGYPVVNSPFEISVNAHDGEATVKILVKREYYPNRTAEKTQKKYQSALDHIGRMFDTMVLAREQQMNEEAKKFEEKLTASSTGDLSSSTTSANISPKLNSSSSLTTQTEIKPSEKKCCTCCGAEKNATTKLFLCGACKSVLYCSRECQQKDWPHHKQYCKKK